MKKQIKASWESYEDKFWDLHESSSVEEGIKIEDIIDELGWTDDFFPEDGEPTADEDQYIEVLSQYLHGRKVTDVVAPDTDDVLKDVANFLKGRDGVKYANYNSSIEGVRFTLVDGYEYQLILQELGR